MYSTSILRFRKLEVHIDNRGYGIERVETKDSAIALASGVRVGMTLSVAQDRLQVPEPMRDLADWARDRMWVGAVCDDQVPPVPSEFEAIWLYVNESGSITSIALTKYGP